MAKRHVNEVGNLHSLFLRLEELVLANSGADEFEEVFKLVIAKLWDERSGKERFRTRANQRETTWEIRALLREADRAWPGILSTVEPALTPEHLAVCVDALARHRISGEGFEVLDGFFEFLVAKAAKGIKGQFFTPRHVVDLCVRMLRPTEKDTTLDPACGSGGFLVQTLNHLRRNGRLTTAAAVREYCSAKLWGFDIDPRAVRVAKTLMVLAGDGSANVLRLNSLLKPEMAGLFAPADEGGGGPALTIEDICRSRLRRHKGFDLILTNPPFAGEVRERQLLEGYALSRRKPRIERDILFLERCTQLLAPGGRMAIVLPHNKFASNAFGAVRDWLLGKVRVLAVVGLGRNTFLPHTHQKASILFARRLREEEKAGQDYPIFFAVSEREGKNSRGQLVFRDGAPVGGGLWERVDHDFEEIAEAFHTFRRAGSSPAEEVA